MWSFGTFCDEFYVSSRLFFKLELEPSRETLLHFFEQIRRANPSMTRFRRRDDGSLLLEEEDGEQEGRRYVRLEPTALKFAIHAPPDAETAGRFATSILTQAPHNLSLSDLDYDYMEAAFCFDLEYRGNHDELVCETLLGDHPLAGLLSGDGHRIIDCQPFVGVTLTEDCSLQAYLDVKSRTSTFEVRTGEYETQALSVHLTVRRYWGFAGPADLVVVHEDLLARGALLVNDRVVPNVVQPLAAAIASRR